MTAKALIVTYREFPDLTLDDRILAAALERRGISTAPARWDDPEVDWAGSSVAILRSTWDYFVRWDEYKRWLDRAHKQTTLLNSFELVSWNLHKRHLLELAALGVPCIPTRLVEANMAGSAGKILAATGWSDLVIKPAISGSAFRTLRVSNLAALAQQAADHLEEILRTGDALVQPYIPEVETAAERALIFIENTFTHGYRKRAFDTTLGVGETSDERHVPSQEELAFARHVLACLPEQPLYARVDFVPNASGPLLMEVEVIDPSLHFDLAPEAAELLAEAVARIVEKKSAREKHTVYN